MTTYVTSKKKKLITAILLIGLLVSVILSTVLSSYAHSASVTLSRSTVDFECGSQEVTATITLQTGSWEAINGYRMEVRNSSGTTVKYKENLFAPNLHNDSNTIDNSSRSFNEVIDVTGWASGSYDVYVSYYYDAGSWRDGTVDRWVGNWQWSGYSKKATFTVTGTGHTLDSGNVTVQATCTTAGTTVYTCTVCNETVTNNGVPAAKGHVWDSGVVTTQPTCTATGVKTYTCQRDGSHHYYEDVAMVAHTWNVVSTTATCTDGGTTTYECSVCHQTRNESGVPLGHNYQISSYQTDPTCTETGTATYVCSRCGDTMSDSVPALGHSYTTTTTLPTCSAQGYTTYTCTRCGYTYNDNYTAIDADAHDWGEWYRTTDPTTSSNGADTRVCKRNPEHTQTRNVNYTGDIQYDANSGGASVSNMPSTTTFSSAVKTWGWEMYRTYERAKYFNELDDATRWILSGQNAVNLALLQNNNPQSWDYGSVTETDINSHNYMTFSTYDASLDKYVWTGGPGGTTFYSTMRSPSSASDFTTSGGTTLAAYTLTSGGNTYSYRAYGTNTTESGAVVSTDVPVWTCHQFEGWNTRKDGSGTDYVGKDWITGTSPILYAQWTVHHNYQAVVTAPTCTEPGRTTYTCPDCGDTYSEPIAALGHDYQGSVTTAPGCVTTGETTYTCSRCGDSYTEPIAALGHDYSGVVTDPTCLAQGYTTYTCSRCGDSYVDDYVAALGHDYVSTVTDPTCTEAGYTTHECSRCHDTYTDTPVAALGHDFQFTEKVAPTCTVDGYDLYDCSRCDAYEHRNVVTAPGHTWDDGEVTTDPTCTETGIRTFTCTVCDATTTATEPALGHNYTSEITTTPGCTTVGERTYTCTRCGDTYTEEVSAYGHDYVGVVTAPTCTEDGYTTYTCSRCGDSYTDDTVAALGHNFVFTRTVAPTCTEEGYDIYTCSRGCGTTENRNTVAATGHTSPESWTVVTSPTCTDAGLNEKRCTVCGVQLDTQVVPANGHSWQLTSTTVAPTCSDTGTGSYECSVCHATKTDIIEIDPSAHDWELTSTTIAPTCSATGTGVYTCTHNAEHTKTDSIAIDPTAHSWGEWEVTTPPTCTAAGVKTRVCAHNANHIDTDSVPATGHTVVEDAAVAPTCSATGLTAGSHCSVCNTVLVAQEEVAIDPTAHDYGEWTVTTPATCSATGVETRYCSHNNAHTETRDIAIDANAHDYGEWTVTTPATCSATGVETRYCSHNNAHTDTRDIAIDASAHNWSLTSTTVAPTCSATGTGVYTCTYNAEHTKTDSIPIDPNAHDWELTSTTVAPTCSSTGTGVYTCRNNAEHTKTDSIPIDPSAHNVVTDAAVAPTCTETGLTAGSHCSLCDTVLVAQEEVAALGHVEAEWVIVTPATCTATGLRTKTCSRCSQVYESEVIEMIPHTWDAGTVTTDPTCTETGVRTFECTVCHTTKTEDEPALGHDFGEWIVTTPATCVATGVETRYCSRNNAHTETRTVAIDEDAHSWGEWTNTTPATCTEAGEDTRVCTLDGSHTETRVAAALGHDYSSETKTSTYLKSAATCTADATYYYKCSRCAASSEGDTNTWYTDTDSKLGHDWGEWTNTTPATCSAVGEDTRVCSRDGSHTETREVAIDATAHSWDAGTQTLAPTCTTAGNMHFVCQYNNAHTKDESIAALGHDYSSETKTDTYLKSAATCTADATYYYKCSRCAASSEGDTDTWYTDTGSALDHDWGEWTVTTPATCSATGVETRYCSHNNAHTETRTLAIDANAHSWDAGTQTLAPTCTTAGNTHYVCQYNNAHTKDEPIAALGHDYESVVTAPTCTEAGYTTYTCSRCDDSYTDDTVAALGHDFQFTETVAPTCTTAGYDVYDCSRCDATENRNEVAALGHNYTSEVTTAPGCTTAGERTYTCSRCGDTYTEVISAIGHDWGEWTQTTDPTCTDAGEETRVCGNDENHVETREVAALGHDYQFTNNVPATCTTGGYDLYTCSRGCGATEQRNATSSLGHDIEGVDWTVVTPATTSSTGLKVKYCTRCHAVVAEEEIPMLTGPAVEDVEIYPGDSAILVGGTVQLTAVITPANASNPAVTWTTSDPAVATVSNSGLVTGVTTGSVTITATSVDDNTVYDTVTVTVAPLMTQTGYIDEGRHYNGVTSGTQINITPLSSYTLQFATTYTPSNYSGATLAPTLSFYTSSAGTTPATLATNTKITMIDLTVAAAPRYYSYTVGAGVSSIPLTSFTEMGTGSAYSLKTGSSSITEKLVFVVDYGQSSSTATSHSPKLQYNLTY